MNKFTILLAICFSFVLYACEKDILPPIVTPSILTGTANSITRTSVILSGNLDYAESMTDYGILYGENIDLNDAIKVRAVSIVGKDYNITLTSLTPETKYFYCAYATIGQKQIRGEIKEFSTKEKLILTTEGAKDISRTEATLQGNLNTMEDINEYGILYGESSNLDNATKIRATNTTNTSFSITLTNLSPGKEYYYCAYAITEKEEYKGETLTFSTIDYGVPSIEDIAITNYDAGSITITANITDDGGIDLSTCGFCWKIEDNNQTITIENDTNIVAPNSRLSITSKINWLKASTDYILCAYATNAKGTGYSKQISITTSKAELADLGKTEAIASENSLQLSTIINSNGGSNLSNIYFLYAERESDLSSYYQAKRQDAIIDSTECSINTTLTGLKGFTKYYIKPQVTNNEGTTYGDIVSFMTSECKPTVTCYTNLFTEDHCVYYYSSILNGEIENTGGLEIISKGFYVSLTEDPIKTGEKIEITDEGNSFTFNLYLSGKYKDSQTYYYCAYAENAKGISYSEVKSDTMYKHYEDIWDEFPEFEEVPFDF